MSALAAAFTSSRRRVLDRFARRGSVVLLAIGCAAVTLRRLDVPVSAWMPSAFAWAILPLVALGAVRATVGSEGLTGETSRLAMFGAPRLRAFAALATVAVCWGALAGAALGSVAIALGHTYADPPVLSDAMVTFGVGAVVAASLACVFLFTHTFGRFFRTVLDTVVLMLGALMSFSPQTQAFSLLHGSTPSAAEATVGLLTAALLAILAAAFRCRAARLAA